MDANGRKENGARRRRFHLYFALPRYEQVIVDVKFFCGALESKKTTDVVPLPANKPLTVVLPPLVAMLSGDAAPFVVVTL